jgi:CheY-like chemotaxis protein
VRTLGEDVEVEVSLDNETWPVFVDPAQFQTGLLNLAVNARDAMPNGGRLTLETGNIVLDSDYARRNPDARPGDYAMIAVTDTGIGMAPDVIERAFEPFFTTKEFGEGSGLGLSMVYGFVKQSGGHIKIYSELGEGTTVRMFLPRAAPDAAAAEAAPRIEEVPKGRETILVVEDDAAVRDFVVGKLTALGYSTLMAGDGPDALAKLESAGPIDLLFCDVILPGGMNGRELAAQISATRPGIRVLFTSGYAENAIVHQGRLDPGVLLLAKPYRTAELARMVRVALGTPAEG